MMADVGAGVALAGASIEAVSSLRPRRGHAMSEQGDELAEVDPEEAASLIADGAYLLDVREPDEWEAGHAPEAHHVPLGDLEARYDELPTDQVIVCVCRGGVRSARAAAALA